MRTTDESHDFGPRSLCSESAYGLEADPGAAFVAGSDEVEKEMAMGRDEEREREEIFRVLTHCGAGRVHLVLQPRAREEALYVGYFF